MDKLSNTQKVLILLGFLIVGGAIGYFWDNISKLWSSDDTKAPDTKRYIKGKFCCKKNEDGTLDYGSCITVASKKGGGSCPSGYEEAPGQES